MENPVHQKLGKRLERPQRFVCGFEVSVGTIKKVIRQRRIDDSHQRELHLPLIKNPISLLNSSGLASADLAKKTLRTAEQSMSDTARARRIWRKTPRGLFFSKS